MALSSTGDINSTPFQASCQATCRTLSLQDVDTAGQLVCIITILLNNIPGNRVSESTRQPLCGILQDSSL